MYVKNRDIHKELIHAAQGRRVRIRLWGEMSSTLLQILNFAYELKIMFSKGPAFQHPLWDRLWDKFTFLPSLTDYDEDVLPVGHYPAWKQVINMHDEPRN